MGAESKIVVNEITSYRACDSIAVKWKKQNVKKETRGYLVACLNGMTSLYPANETSPAGVLDTQAVKREAGEAQRREG